MHLNPAGPKGLAGFFEGGTRTGTREGGRVVGKWVSA